MISSFFVLGVRIEISKENFAHYVQDFFFQGTLLTALPRSLLKLILSDCHDRGSKRFLILGHSISSKSLWLPSRPPTRPFPHFARQQSCVVLNPPSQLLSLWTNNGCNDHLVRPFVLKWQLAERKESAFFWKKNMLSLYSFKGLIVLLPN